MGMSLRRTWPVTYAQHEAASYYRYVIGGPPLRGRLSVTFVRPSVCPCPVPVPFTESVDTLLG